MKKSLFLFIAATAVATGAAAQTDTSKTETRSDTAMQAVPQNNLPDHLKDVTSSTIQPKHYLPVLGAYATADGVTNVTIEVDEKNAGIVWIDGLPQGKIKGLLKKGPAVYKIPAQKSASGKAISEGTLIYNSDTKTLQLCTGCGFKDADPAATLAGTKGIKVWQLNRVEDAVGQIQQ